MARKGVKGGEGRGQREEWRRETKKRSSPGTKEAERGDVGSKRSRWEGRTFEFQSLQEPSQV
eukprot:503234-Hanusia_phi.AAC.2